MKLKQGASFLLILLFCFISGAQLLHTHSASSETHHEQGGDQEQVQLSDKCSICDYFLQIQSKQIFSNDLLILPRLFPQVMTFPDHYFTGNYKITVQGFTNKGPPQSL